VRSLAVLLTLAACSYKPGIGGDPQTDGPADDAPPIEADSGEDASPDAPPSPPSVCVQNWLAGTMTFTAPAFLRANGGALATTLDERDPFLSSDELVLLYVRSNDIFLASRPNLTTDFNSPGVAALSDATQADSKATMSGDDLTAIVASQRANGEGANDFWYGTRATAGVTAFSALTQTFLENVNDTGEQRDPYLSADGLHLYFAESSNPQRIVLASRLGTDQSFGTPVTVPDIGDLAGDADPTLTADERVILFASRRTGEGGIDLWYATRVERDQPFSAPIALAEINSNEDDADPHLSSDGCRLYFSTRSTPGGGDFDLLFTQQE